MRHILTKRIAGVVFVLSFLLSASVTAQLEFSPHETYPLLGAQSQAIIALDVDSDGNTDLITAHLLGACLSLHRGIGDGRFLPAELVYDFGVNCGHPDTLVAGDFDEDGHADLAVTRRFAGDLVLLFGDGSGRFFFHTQRQLNAWPGPIATDDLDRDGHLDLVVLLTQTAKVVVLYGDGLGSFPVMRQNSTMQHPSVMTVLDANRDRFLDLAIGSGATGEILLLLGNRSRELSLRDTRTLSGGQTGMVSGDWNGDSIPDLAISRYSGRSVTLLPIGFSGSLDQPTTRLPLGTPPTDMWVADFNNDGRPDLLTANPESRSASIALGIGDGTFQDAQEFPMGIRSVSMATGDFDHDCLIDFAIAGGEGEVSVRLNRTLTSQELRLGNVNAGAGNTRNVLFLNGKAGEGEERIVEYDVLSPFRISMSRPPAVEASETARFVVYLWNAVPRCKDGRRLPDGLGALAMPIPLAGGGEPSPTIIWNNAMRHRLLGSPTRPSQPAPSDLVNVQTLRRVGPFYIQGIIFDPGSEADIPASVTNGIVGFPVFGQ